MSYGVSEITATSHYRATFAVNPRGLTPRRASELFRGLGDFFVLSNVLELAPELVADEEAHERGLVSAIDEVLKKDVLLVQVSMSSPLEVILAISGSVTILGATVHMTGRRALDLFDRFQKSRQLKGDTDLRLQAYSIIEAELHRELSVGQRLKLLEGSHAVQSWAITCMTSLNALEVIIDGEATGRGSSDAGSK